MNVLNFYKDKLPENYIYIGRPSKWGNPFIIGKDGTREQVVEKYERWIVAQPQLLKSLNELDGMDLVCYCAPKLCHGHVLKQLVELFKEGKI